MRVPENIDPKGHHTSGLDVHVQFATVAEAIKRLEQLLEELDRRYSEMFESVNRRWDGQIYAIKDQMAEVDKRYAAEFVKFGTISRMMTEQQALALQATKEAASIAMNASEKAIAKSEAASEKRFEAVNEFRAQLNDQQQTFARKDLVDQRAEGLEKKLDDITRGLEARISDNKDRISSMEARGQAYSQGFGWIATGIGIVAAIAGAVVAVFFRTGGI